MQTEPTLQIEIDLDAAVVRISADGHQVAEMPWPVDRAEAGSAVVRINYEFRGRTIAFTTRQGDRIEVELPDQNDLAPTRNRPVVYLDQNHWSAIAKALHEPRSVRDERQGLAAERVAELAQQRKVILPLSFGHVGETGQWRDDSRRYRLALTMLELSNGWQLRDVFLLRRAELQQALATSLGRTAPAPVRGVTLEPGAIVGRAGPYRPLSTFDAELAFVNTALVEFSVVFDIMLQDAATQLESVPGWVDRLQRITRDLAAEGPDARRRRAVSFETFRRDLRHEVAAAAVELGITATDADEWLTTLNEGQLASMPSLSIYRELLHEKLSDPGTIWEQNDLTDMMYLSCGTAYADHVVGERRLISDLRRALARLGRHINVHPKLADLVLAVDR